MSKVINLKSVEETTLYKELLKRDHKDTKNFISNIIQLCEDASIRAKSIPKYFYEYTLHDETHFLRVTELGSVIFSGD